MIDLTVNNQAHSLDVEPDKPLLWVVREDLGMCGSKFGCGKGLCGACSMHLDGKLVRTCVLPIAAAAGKHVVTIEGLSPQGDHPVQRAWVAEDVPQCGYCQSGQVMAAVALLKARLRPSEAEIDAAMSNICRCGTYQKIRAAIHRAMGRLAGKKE